MMTIYIRQIRLFHFKIKLFDLIRSMTNISSKIVRFFHLYNVEILFTLSILSMNSRYILVLELNFCFESNNHLAFIDFDAYLKKKFLD